MRRPLLVTLVLAGSGALIGALAAPLLSAAASRLASAPLTAGRITYVFGPSELAMAGAVSIPLLTWLLMRRVPLWRALVVPAVGASLGLLIAIATTAPPFAQPLLILAGSIGAALWLKRSYRSNSVSVEAAPPAS